ncbi:MAG: hypothetical protein HKO64_09370 [Xanthomonadales bacterium]|nr:hypothetical protein [Xanthomonadales bacterium]
MSSVHTLRRWRGPAFVAVYLWTISALAQTPEPVFQVPSDPEVPVISYSETPELLGNPDRTPRVQVFGDGLVWVHYPVYMKKAGDYQMQLNPVQLHKLLSEVSAIFDFDVEAVMEEQNRRLSQARAQGGLQHFRSETTREDWEFNLSSFQDSPTSSGRPVNHKITWNNDYSTVDEHPALKEFADLVRAREAIQALLDSNNLKKVDVASHEDSPP